MIRSLFVQETEVVARRQWRALTDQLRTKIPKLTKLTDAAQADSPASMALPKAHQVQIHSTDLLERLLAEMKRHAVVVGIFPNEAAITRRVGAALLEQNDNWQLHRRRIQLRGLQQLTDNQPASLSVVIR